MKDARRNGPPAWAWAGTAALLCVACGGRYVAPPSPYPPGFEVRDEYRANASEAITLEQFDVAEKHLMKLMEYDRKTIEPSWSDYRKLWHIYRYQGRYEKAIAAFKVYMENARGPTIEFDRKGWWRDLGRTYQAQGRYDEAMECLEEATRLVASEGRYPYYVDSSWGAFWLERGDCAKALAYFEPRLERNVQKRLHPGDIAIARADVARAYYYAGNYAKAAELLREASLGAAGVPIMLSVPAAAEAVTFSARAEERLGARERAVRLCEVAVKMVSGFPGYRVEKADAYSALAGFRFRQGRLAEARAAYEEAARLRRETATQTHPNYADALKGLADVAAAEDELTSATVQAERALAVLDASVAPTHPRTAQVLVALDALYTLTGQPCKAGPPRQRLETILQEPLGIWKEDFLLTAHFHAQLLEKKGKPEAARRLRDLQARQEGRR